MIDPHGGELVDLLARAEKREELVKEASSLNSVSLTPRQAADLELLAVGGFSPLRGFQGSDDWRRVVDEMRLADGLPWSIPVTLATQAQAAEGDRLALHDESGRLLGVIDVEEVFERDLEREARHVYRTTDSAHPGVAAIQAEGTRCLAGPVRATDLPEHPDAFGKYLLPPAASRAAFAERGWKTVVGFQTRNPIHRAHEYITKAALESVDGLFIHPLVGETKSDDIPADVRMRCYEVLLEHYYVSDHVLLAINPAAMRYAGPREAIFHALIRKNYGCTHFIVGRDHAGVGDYYGTYDAQEIFSELDPQELGIEPMMFEHSFYCKLTKGMATSKTSPAGPDDRVFLSGTKVREMLRAGQRPPEEFTRPEVADILINAMRESSEGQGVPA
jgi:sulfate adenylyltransferase